MQPFRKFLDMPKKKKNQVVIAFMISLSLLISAPTYSWFRRSQEMARFEKVSSPNTLYITAARREDAKNFKVGGVDVSAFWVDENKNSVERKSYQDYVFAVAGDYVYSYTLQLAHTTNNNYTYEIFKAEVMPNAPTGENVVLDRDYIEYKLTETYDPATMAAITADPVYENKHAGDTLYYRVKTGEKVVSFEEGEESEERTETVGVSLNAKNYTVANTASLEPSTYTVDGSSVSYSGHYLNWSSKFAANSTYHIDTYGTDQTNVQEHAEPLYWQANHITGGDPTRGNAFYHEYILRISWDIDGSNKASVDNMKLNAIYDVSDLSAAKDAKSMKLTFTVSEKQNYGAALKFSDYIDDFTLYSYDAEAETKYSAITSGEKVSIDTSDTYKVVYTVKDPTTVFNYDADKNIYQIPVDFNAVIDSAFGKTKKFSNYKINLEVEMYTEYEPTNDNKIDGSNDSDHVIFTHAKILTDVIEPK